LGTIDTSERHCYITIMERVIKRAHAEKSTRELLTRVALAVLVIVMLGASPLTAETTLQTEMLQLNTTILADSVFEFQAASPYLVEIGTRQRISYHFSSNSPMKLTITSDNSPVVGSQMKMVHESVSSAFLPYYMYFDYAGTGPQNEQLVENGVATSMESLELDGTFSILVPENETALAGDYSDTITFSFTMN